MVIADLNDILYLYEVKLCMFGIQGLEIDEYSPTNAKHAYGFYRGF
jgi:hypothetical protein